MLVITDHFTRYAQVLVTTSQTAQHTAKALMNNYITHYGLPLAIISNQGRNFKSNVMQEMCELAQVCKLHTTPYHPQGNEQCEHFNSTLISMIGILEARDKFHWRDFVWTLVHTYNCLHNNATQFSPYFLMFSWKPKLPLGLQFRLQTEKQHTKTHNEFVAQLEKNSHMHTNWQGSHKTVTWSKIKNDMIRGCGVPT